MSSLADRLKLASKGKGREVIPSIQDMINCGDAGNCNGGDPNAANAWVHKSGGIPDVTCQQYQAKNMNCSAEARCMNCAGWNCYAVPDDLVPKVKVAEFGSVVGDDKIQAEIFARGPVSCTIDASVLGWVTANGTTGYSGGVCNYTTAPRLDHAIQIAGWGATTDGVPYWLGRNSWGTCEPPTHAHPHIPVELTPPRLRLGRARLVSDCAEGQRGGGGGGAAGGGARAVRAGHVLLGGARVRGHGAGLRRALAAAAACCVLPSLLEASVQLSRPLHAREDGRMISRGMFCPRGVVG